MMDNFANVPFPVDQVVYAKFKKAWELNELDKLMCGDNGYLHYISREMAEWQIPQDWNAMLWRGFVTHWHLLGKSNEVPQRFIEGLKNVMQRSDVGLVAVVISGWLLSYFYSKAEQVAAPTDPQREIFMLTFNGLEGQLKSWFLNAKSSLMDDKRWTGDAENLWVATGKVEKRIQALGGPNFII